MRKLRTGSNIDWDNEQYYEEIIKPNLPRIKEFVDKIENAKQDGIQMFLNPLCTNKSDINYTYLDDLQSLIRYVGIKTNIETKCIKLLYYPFEKLPSENIPKYDEVIMVSNRKFSKELYAGKSAYIFYGNIPESMEFKHIAMLNTESSETIYDAINLDGLNFSQTLQAKTFSATNAESAKTILSDKIIKFHVNNIFILLTKKE